jgi:hypothetical protein
MWFFSHPLIFGISALFFVEKHLIAVVSKESLIFQLDLKYTCKTLPMRVQGDFVKQAPFLLYDHNRTGGMGDKTGCNAPKQKFLETCSPLAPYHYKVNLSPIRIVKYFFYH